MDDGVKMILAEEIAGAILGTLEEDLVLGWYHDGLRDGLEQTRWWQQVAQREVVRVQATEPSRLRWTDLLNLDVANVRSSEYDEDLANALVGLAATVIAWLVDIEGRNGATVAVEPEPILPLKFGFALPDFIAPKELELIGADCE